MGSLEHMNLLARGRSLERASPPLSGRSTPKSHHSPNRDYLHKYHTVSNYEKKQRKKQQQSASLRGCIHTTLFVLFTYFFLFVIVISCVSELRFTLYITYITVVSIYTLTRIMRPCVGFTRFSILLVFLSLSRDRLYLSFLHMSILRAKNHS